MATCLLMAALGVCAQTQEQDSLRVINLQEVEVISTRATNSTPVAFTNIGKEQLKKQKKLTEAAEKAASDASVQAGEAAGLMQRCREELTEGVKGYIAQFLPEEETQEILRKELPDHELCLFIKNQESSVQTGLEEIQKQKKVYQDLLKKKEEFTTQSEQHAKEFQKLQISLEKRKSQLESIQEQLQNQLDEPVLTLSLIHI